MMRKTFLRKDVTVQGKINSSTMCNIESICGWIYQLLIGTSIFRFSLFNCLSFLDEEMKKWKREKKNNDIQIQLTFSFS